MASGTRIRSCNKSELNTHVFSLSPSAKHTTLVRVTRRGERFEHTGYRLPGKGRKGLKPGECDHFTVRNPTSKPLRPGLYDEIHSKVRLELTIRPEP